MHLAGALKEGYKVLIKFVNHKSAAEFWLKPCCLGRHDISTIGDIHDLLHADGIESQGHLHLATVNTAFEFAKSTQSTDEIDALVAA